MSRGIVTAALFAAMLSIALSGCGGGSPGKPPDSIEVLAGGTVGVVTVKGIGGTLQLSAVGIYGPVRTDITNQVTWNITPTGIDVNTGAALPAPPQTITVDRNGMVTAVEPSVCTWDDLNTGKDVPPANPLLTPAWFLSGSYKFIATFNGVTSQPIFVPVASAAGNGPAFACGP